jgi:2-polyprenyl-6-methoxyphenol hydroxylase-like FAD-dependent oxidoreductase
MSSTIETKVLVVGAGPVGLTLAMDLAWRGIDVVVAELREAGAKPSVKCGQISARSMEIFRRLGVADKLRAAGLPADYPNDIVSATSVTGIELSRVPIPARGRRYNGAEGPDTTWPTPEHTHRINQIFFEPILIAHATAQPRIRILNRTEVESFTQDESGVAAVARDLDRGERFAIACKYLVGCDGAKSMVRAAIGAKYEGTPVLQRVQSTCIRAPALLPLLPSKPAWNYLSLNPRRCGSTMAVDGRETWMIHNYLYHGETDFESVDRDWAIRTILGVGAAFRYEAISKEDWIARRLVADRFRERRAFICGDAAHLWIPHGGYGMNAGIADAGDLAWMLAGTLEGWAAPGILDAYEAERRPITDQVSRLIADVAQKVIVQRRGITEDIERQDSVGESTRARIGADAYELDVCQQCCGGLNFGYFYDGSPIIAYDDEPHPAYTMRDFTISTVPGCRAPHLWLSDGRSLYDVMGPGYSLICGDPSVEISGLVEAAARRDVPLSVVELDAPNAAMHYPHKLMLVRPDQHVAWRGNDAPTSPTELIETMCGARAARRSVSSNQTFVSDVISDYPGSI